MGFRPFDRLPVLEWAPWWELTITRWHREGLPAELTDRYGICRHFGLEIYKQDWFRVFSPDCPQPTHYGAGIIATEADYERIRKYLFPPEPVDHGQWEAWAREQADGDVVLWFTVEGFSGCRESCLASSVISMRSTTSRRSCIGSTWTWSSGLPR